MSQKVLFIDRDGTLIVEPDDFQVDRLSKVQLMPNVIPSLLRLAAANYRFVMVSNQDGLGTDSFPQNEFDQCQQHVLSLFESQGVSFDSVFVCPHRADDRCACRKPATGLLTRFLAATDIDIDASAVIGDRDTDTELAKNVGIRGIKLDEKTSWPDIADRLITVGRRATTERRTAETSITVSVDIDQPNPVSINTGIGFFDHMLEQIARHAGISLQVSCQGDLIVDEHHTVEDTAICIGEALRQSLGDKRGIDRYGFTLPMDESEAAVSIDLSGRPFFVFNGEFTRERVGEMPTELVGHFFQTLSQSLGAALHITVTGDNAHHMVEACFKCVGRALRQAMRRDGADIPSTKGTLT